MHTRNNNFDLCEWISFNSHYQNISLGVGMSKNILSSILITLSLIGLSACKEKNSDRFDTNPISVEIAGHTFVFPRNYSMGKHEETIGITLLMPEFQPRTIENERLIENVSLRRYIRIVLGGGDLTKRANSEFLIRGSNENQLKFLLEKNATKYTAANRIKNDVVYYEALSGPKDVTVDDLYVYYRKGGVQFILECPSKNFKQKLELLCTSSSNVFGNMHLKYWYPIQYLPNAEEIHRKIKNMLVSFHKGEEK